MKINLIKCSCCGANERVNIDEAISFLIKNPNAEIGISISQKNCEVGMPRYNWVLDFLDRANELNLSSRIAFHINGVWAKETILKGKLPNPVGDFIKASNGANRIQINAVRGDYKLNDLPYENTLKLIDKVLPKYSKGKIILTYSDDTQEFIKKIAKNTKNFDVLYDSSFGFAVNAKSYHSFFPELLQGYAGGLCGENISQEIAKIEKVQSQNVNIWLDAEGNLRDKEKETLDLKKAQKFVDIAFKTIAENENINGIS